MKRFVILALTLGVLSGTQIAGQPKPVTIFGRVSSFDESLALEGVTVQVKGTKNVTGTLSDGAYSLVINKEDKLLVFSFTGYETKEVAITNATEYNVVLKPKGSCR